MKSSNLYFSTFFFILFVFFVSANTQETLNEKANVSGQELWEKVVAHHDPLGKWNTYTGEMHMVTVIGKNYIVEEIIEIDKPNDLYKCTRIEGDTKVIKGIQHGEYFYAINQDTNPSEQLKNQHGLSDANTSGHKEHHTCHFGYPMELRTSGMTVDPVVKVVEFDGRKCFALRFNGDADQVKHSYYEGMLTFYVDMTTFAMRGMRWENPNYPAGYLLICGEIEVNGIKIPHVKAGFRSDDDSQWWTSTYTIIKNQESGN